MLASAGGIEESLPLLGELMYQSHASYSARRSRSLADADGFDSLRFRSNHPGGALGESLKAE